MPDASVLPHAAPPRRTLREEVQFRQATARLLRRQVYILDDLLADLDDIRERGEGGTRRMVTAVRVDIAALMSDLAFELDLLEDDAEPEEAEA